jgi:hypothetical protein
MMRLYPFILLAAFAPAGAYAQLTLNLGRTTVNVVSTVFLDPPSQANGVQGNNNVHSNLDGATTYNQSYTSTAAQGSGTSTVTEAFTSAVSANGTHILSTLNLNSPSMSWSSSAAEVPYAAAGVTLTVSFTSSTAFSYNIGLTSTGGTTNNNVFTSASRTLNFTNLSTNQVLLTDFSMTDASYTNTLPAGNYRIIISSGYGGPFSAGDDGFASRTFSASVDITAIPEPSTTALYSAVVIFGIVGARKLEGRKRSISGGRS